MPKAVWNDTVIADSPETVMIEGTHYFPPTCVRREHLQPADKTRVCHWKGTASFFDVVVDGRVNSGAAWAYPDPKAKATHIRDHVAFRGGVRVVA